MKTVAPESLVKTPARDAILFSEAFLAEMEERARAAAEEKRRMDCLLEAFRL